MVWERSKGSGSIIEAAVRPASSGVWQAPVPLSGEGQTAYSPGVAVDPQGNAIAVWARYDASDSIVEAAVRPAASELWQGPVALSATGQHAEAPHVAFDLQGNAIAVWQRYGTNDIIEAAARPAASGVWQTPVPVSVAKMSIIGEFPQVAVDPQGDAVAVWDQSNGSNYIVEAAVRLAASGVWQTPTPLSVTGQNSYLPQVAVDLQGNAVAVWERQNPGNSITEAAGYDATGPLLHSLVIPSTGIVGQPLSFSVSPLDVWSMIGQTTWSFGDGSSATGTSVTHPYTAAGVYHVTVTGADLLGNTTSATGTVAVRSLVKITPCTCIGRRHLLLYNAHLTNKRFRVARRATAISAAAPVGTRFEFTLWVPARLRIKIVRSAPGLRHRRSCVAPTRTLTHSHAKHCTRTLTLGTLIRSNEPQGTDSIFFSGRIGHRALSPHAYKAILQARSTSRLEDTTLSFTIVR